MFLYAGTENNETKKRNKDGLVKETKSHFQTRNAFSVRCYMMPILNCAPPSHQAFYSQCYCVQLWCEKAAFEKGVK